MSREELPSADGLPGEQAVSSGEGIAPAASEVAAGRPWAGPLAMGAGGLLAGIIGWLILEIRFPFFFVSEELRQRIPLSFPPPELLAEFAAEQRAVNVWNAGAAGMVLGTSVALLFALVQGAGRGYRQSRLPMALCVVCGSVAGALAGLASQIVLNRLLAATEPMTAAVVFQAVFWALLGGGAGAGAGCFAGSGSRFLGLLLQGVLVGAVFGLVYASVAAFAFPVDNAERLVPTSLANRAIWAMAGLGLLGLLLGSAAERGRARPR